MKFYTVDAFSSVAFGGNPSAIVLLDEGDNFPTLDEIYQIANELGYDETAFVKTIDEDRFNIRFFNMNKEINMSTSSVIGAFTVMLQDNKIIEKHHYLCETLGGDLLVHINDDEVFIEVSADENFGDIDEQRTLDSIYSHMGIPRETVIKEKATNLFGDFMPEPVSSSLPDVFMPVLSQSQINLLGKSMSTLANIGSSQDDNLNSPLGHKQVKMHAVALKLDDVEDDSHFQEFDNMIKSKTMEKPIRKLGLIENVDGEVKIKIGGSGIILTDGHIFL